MTRKVVRDEKVGRVVPDEISWYEMILARKVPAPFEGSIRTHRVVWKHMSRAMIKRVLCHMRTTKAQISLRIHAVWSAPLFLAA